MNGITALHFRQRFKHLCACQHMKTSQVVLALNYDKGHTVNTMRFMGFFGNFCLIFYDHFLRKKNT